jgi:hypothetical protein
MLLPSPPSPPPQKGTNLNPLLSQLHKVILFIKEKNYLYLGNENLHLKRV